MENANPERKQIQEMAILLVIIFSTINNSYFVFISELGKDSKASFWCEYG